MLTFVHSWVFWLAVLPLLVWWLVPAKQQNRPAVRVPFFDRVRKSTGGSDGAALKARGLPWLGRSLVWLLILLALARPMWVEEPIERSVPTRDLLLAVDLSGSMDHEDFTDLNGKAVDRLTAVKEVLGDFLTKRTGDRVGLVVFGSSPFLLAPFTTDLELSRQLLEETEVRMAGPRTAFGDAIGLGIRLFEESTAPAKTMIVLTDGNDTASSVPPVEAARVAKDRGITIYAVAMGDPETVGEEKLDVEALVEVAETAGGAFFLALDRDELDGIYEKLNRIETSETKTVSHRPRRDLFYWPLAAALLLSLVTQGWGLMRSRPSLSAAPPMARVRVDPRTHELGVSSP
jgi:Ca-activated chloride channel family protein